MSTCIPCDHDDDVLNYDYALFLMTELHDSSPLSSAVVVARIVVTRRAS